MPLPQELFRAHAIEAPIPVLPAHLARPDFQGRVVVEVVVSGGGGPISSMKMLESSDSSLARLTEATLARWRFRPFTDTSPKLKDALVSTRLIFYFSAKAGRGYTTDAVFEILERDRRRYEDAKK